MARNTSGLKRYTIDERYDIYRRKYIEAQDKLAQKHGKDMFDNMLSKKQFENMYNAYKNTRAKEGKKPGNITRDIITRQTYEYSQKQSRLFAKKLKEKIGKDVKEKDVRASKYNSELSVLWDDIEEFRRNKLKELEEENEHRRANGEKLLDVKKELKKLVSQEFFGSD